MSSEFLTQFRQTGSVRNIPHHRRRNVLTSEKMDNIKSVFENDPSTSIRKVSAALNTSQTSVHRDTRLLKLHPYRVNVVQELLPADYPKRIDFCNWILQFVKDVGQFDYFFFSDEA